MINLFKLLGGKWEEVRGSLQDDLEHIEAALNQFYSQTFDRTGKLQVTALPPEVPLANLPEIDPSTLLGRGSLSGQGTPETITLGPGLEMEGTILDVVPIPLPPVFPPGNWLAESDSDEGQWMVPGSSGGPPGPTGATGATGAQGTASIGPPGEDGEDGDAFHPPALIPVIYGTVGIVIDGAGSTITTGVKGFIYIPYDCTILEATLLSSDAAATSGSIVIDIWKDVYVNYPPTIADTITASAKPTLSTAISSRDTTLTGWTKSIRAGDVLGFTVDSVTTLTKVTLILKVVR